MIEFELGGIDSSEMIEGESPSIVSRSKSNSSFGWVHLKLFLHITEIINGDNDISVLNMTREILINSLFIYLKIKTTFKEVIVLRLVWTLPGKTKIVCHLKDKKKIRNKKRC